MVKASKDVMISFNGVDMKLSITSASTSYSGTYKVVVSNEYGQDESSARLVVKVRKEIRKWSNVRLSLYIYILMLQRRYTVCLDINLCLDLFIPYSYVIK